MPDDEWAHVSREDFERALSDMGHVVDVSVNDLVEVTAKAREHARLRQREGILIRDLMSQPVKTIAPDTTLAAAAEQMLTQRISGLPVVDDANRLIGIVTEADFLGALGIPCHHPSRPLWQRLGEMFAAAGTTLHGPGDSVASVMTGSVVSADPGQTLHDALELMKAHQVKRLVVVDGERIPVGMITRSDLIRAFFKRVHWPNPDDD